MGAPESVPEADVVGHRGVLTIKDRAIERIASAAALQVPGVVRQSGNLSLLTGRELPRADVTTGGGAVAVNLYIAAEWPYDAAALTRRVHDAVARGLHEYTGLSVHELNVVVAATVPAGPDVPAEQSVPVEYLESDIVASRTVPRSEVPVVAPLPPLATPAAAPAAALIAVASLGLAFVAARELLIVRGTYGGAPWLRNSFEWFGRLHWQPWIAPVAAMLVLLGFAALAVALKPRRRTHLPLRVAGPVPTVWMRRTDLARMCSAHATALTGVHTARTVVDRRRAVVDIVAAEDASGAELTAAVRDEGEPNLALLAEPLPLVVKIARARVRADSTESGGIRR
ncbi:Asp23/Gls24 family envelope stress response protein [Rhodococcus sp. CC-R104]|uniref:Asp23/Gls24 family envelope stress response protein n=1 Tax=Rhodococcus chondri TaxID=3065941 RepID=A0ABU7JTD0_9NOCA|nr:DUF6286 domain-containing Asp23/Gls24 family envelope stress response protein [Rhodococcus sp. CC-R104]MEE2033288.1 Asp23/Gls24 family envelope stress response protein [Rhodococcus sp. CC-R104]